jgi:peptide-methionine (S)-S-oxide reductase
VRALEVAMRSLLWTGGIVAALVAAGAILASIPPSPTPSVPSAGNPALGTRPGNVGRGAPLAPSAGHELAIFAQGCFWGVEERFRRVAGVVATAVGYTGGQTPNPTYEAVSGGRTGHVEAVLVEYDPRRVSYRALLDTFWATHDPTTANRQGRDRGTQYRSAIFALDAAQLDAARRSRVEEQKALVEPITTEIAPAGPFWLAEAHHQQWDEKHGTRSCPAPARAQRR